MSIFTPKVDILSCIVESKQKKISFNDNNEEIQMSMPNRGPAIFPPRKKNPLVASPKESPSEADIRGSNPELAGHTSHYYARSSFYNTRNTFKLQDIRQTPFIF
jgi:hypothetical protein